MQPFSIQIDSVVDLLQLSRDPKGGGGSSYQVKCPFCGDSKYHMNINTVKNTYYCFSCGGSRTGGGALDLYGRVALGKELIPGKAEDGGNGSYLYAKLADALGMQRGVVHYARNNGNSQKDYGIRPASDENLNRAYSALLNIRELSLTNFHREKLMERGLDRVSIERNGYRSVLPYFDWGSVFWEDAAEYGRLGIYDAAMKYRQLRRQRKNILVGGYVVARILERQGISMEGVPGFFRLNDRWVFRLEPGMLIPTRNRDGLIVGLQTRKDDGDIRYMTVSSKDFPGGVTEKISRAHFPLANAPLTENSKILITEGPLKADVATSAFNGPSVMSIFEFSVRGALASGKCARDIFSVTPPGKSLLDTVM